MSIKYIEKGAGLHEAITKAGLSLLNVDGEWASSDDAAVQAIIDAYDPLPEAVQSALQAIDSFHAETVQKLAGSPTQAEKDTWSFKQSIATRIIGKSELDVPEQAFVAGAGMSGDDLLDWAHSVIKNASIYAQAIGVAEELRSKARAAVSGAKTVGDVAAVLDEHAKLADAAISRLLGSA